jgi:hypothetical protein
MLHTAGDPRLYPKESRKLDCQRYAGRADRDIPLAKSAPGVACTSRYAPCLGVDTSVDSAVLCSFASGEPPDRPGGVV